MPEDQLKLSPQNKLYKPFAIQLATFLGGPLVAGYLIAENFKLLGEPEKVRITWIHAILVTAIFYLISFVIPELNKIPPVIIPLLLSGLASYLVQRYQGEKIKEHILSNGSFYSTWRAILVSLIGGIITAVIFVMIIILTDKELLQKMAHQ